MDIITYAAAKSYTDGAIERIDFKPINYSLDECMVGTWIDGKPLYEKTIIFYYDSPEWQSWEYYHGIPNIELVISCQGLLTHIENNVLVSDFVPCPGNAKIWATPQYIGFAQVGDLSGKTFIFTLVYTKTTDYS